MRSKLRLNPDELPRPKCLRTREATTSRHHRGQQAPEGREHRWKRQPMAPQGIATYSTTSLRLEGRLLSPQLLSCPPVSLSELSTGSNQRIFFLSSREALFYAFLHLEQFFHLLRNAHQ